MKLSWTKGKDEAVSKEISDNFKASALTRERLKELLEEVVASAENSSLTKDGYGVPNWAYLQADIIGYKRAIKEVLSLISK